MSSGNCAPNVSFGPRLKAYAVGLAAGHFVALDRTGDLIADQYGVRPSDGAVQNWIIDAGCNAHHLRELRYGEELTGHFWPSALRHPVFWSY